MPKTAFIIIYNHQFNQNIEILERIYANRFSYIFHLVPFYRGDKQNVIPVYENSFFFQGYVAQGLASFYKEEFTHYFFVADDMLLHPKINESNLTDFFELSDNDNFLPGIVLLHESPRWWQRTGEALKWSMKVKGVEVKKQLPKMEEAYEKFHAMGLYPEKLPFDQIWKFPLTFKEVGRMILFDPLYPIRKFINLFTRQKYKLPYPIAGSYSDIFIVNAKTIKDFSHLCGVFAATRLFVELGLPTAMILSSNHIVTENDLARKGKLIWDRKKDKTLDRYNFKLKALLDDFPDELLYIHPVKLSQWDTQL